MHPTFWWRPPVMAFQQHKCTSDDLKAEINRRVHRSDRKINLMEHGACNNEIFFKCYRYGLFVNFLSHHWWRLTGEKKITFRGNLREVIFETSLLNSTNWNYHKYPLSLLKNQNLTDQNYLTTILYIGDLLTIKFFWFVVARPVDRHRCVIKISVARWTI